MLTVSCEQDLQNFLQRARARQTYSQEILTLEYLIALACQDKLIRQKRFKTFFPILDPI